MEENRFVAQYNFFGVNFCAPDQHAFLVPAGYTEVVLTPEQKRINRIQDRNYLVVTIVSGIVLAILKLLELICYGVAAGMFLSQLH